VREMSSQHAPADLQGPRKARAVSRSRPLTARQELVFFGVTFTVALVLQLFVVLKLPTLL